jgi:hypothetical protein
LPLNVPATPHTVEYHTYEDYEILLSKVHLRTTASKYR